MNLNKTLTLFSVLALLFFAGCSSIDNQSSETAVDTDSTPNKIDNIDQEFEEILDEQLMSEDDQVEIGELI